MPSLVLGPLLRHAGERDATVWVETDGRCTVEVLGCKQETFCVAGHFYALVHVTGLEPGANTEYEVTLDGERVWPLEDWPASTIRTTRREDPVDIVFGSCRTAAPHEPPYTLRKDEDDRGREVDALRALAVRLRDRPPEERPGALLMLGDQIYADEVEPTTRAYIHNRRDVSESPGEQLAGFEEYTYAYRVSWSEPSVRWLFSTVPTAMVIDDHDVIDDWNTSREWVEEIRREPWWNERIVGAFMSYWIYQHLGNLSPEALAEDRLWPQVCEAEDAEEVLRQFAYDADRRVDSTQWSFCRDIGPARLVMVDSRAGRILGTERRAMVDDDEWAFIESNAVGDGHEHVLIGTSLPWLLAPGMHHLEAWDEAITGGAWGRLAARAGEWLRQELDLEHWGAFNDSWRKLTEMVGRLAEGESGPPPATIVALSGDVHHAYLAEVAYPNGTESRVYQAVCSPFRNPLDATERRVIKAAASRPAAALTGAMARAAGVPPPDISWKLRADPIFANVVGTLTLHGRSASLRIERAQSRGQGSEPTLETAYEARL